MIYAILFVLGYAVLGYLLVRMFRRGGSCADGPKLLEMLQVECAQRLPLVNRYCGSGLPEGQDLNAEERRLLLVFVSIFQALKQELDRQNVASVRDLNGPEAFGYLHMARAALFPDRFFRQYLRSLDRQQRVASKAMRQDWQQACKLFSRLEKMMSA